jgi:hypothetical protein
MPEPCRSCERREVDWGGCRCQAFALTGNAAHTDPACALSTDRELLAGARDKAQTTAPDFIYASTRPRRPDCPGTSSLTLKKSAYLLLCCCQWTAPTHQSQ